MGKLAAQGYGIIKQPSFVLEEDIASGRLVRILSDWSVQGLNLYVIYLSRKFLSAKVRAFVDHLVEVAA